MSVRGKDLMTTGEVAKAVARSEVAVRVWIRRGLLPAVRVGRMLLVERKDLEKMPLPKRGPRRGGGG